MAGLTSLDPYLDIAMPRPALRSPAMRSDPRVRTRKRSMTDYQPLDGHSERPLPRPRSSAAKPTRTRSRTFSRALSMVSGLERSPPGGLLCLRQSSEH